MTQPREPWDGVSDFDEDDEPLDRVRAIAARPPDAITGEESGSAAVPGDPQSQVQFCVYPLQFFEVF